MDLFYPVRTSAFGGLTGIAKDFFSDDPLGRFVQPRVKRGLKLQVFGPDSPVEEQTGSPNHERSLALPLVSVRLQTVPAAERGEESALPHIGE
jgi:hypothetical protein